jgi:hypothetical protein
MLMRYRTDIISAESQSYIGNPIPTSTRDIGPTSGRYRIGRYLNCDIGPTSGRRYRIGRYFNCDIGPTSGRRYRADIALADI